MDLLSGINGSHNQNNGNGAGGGTGTGDSGSGGGGSYGSSGVDGQNQGQHSGGLAGITVGDNALNKLILGGAGGEGGADEDGARPGKGGNGGGIIYIVSNEITGTGSITSNGEDGSDGQQIINGIGGSGSGTGGGGAGSGGSIVLKGNVINLGSATISAVGGSGGTGTHGQVGGSGGLGRVKVQSLNSNLASTPVSYNEISSASNEINNNVGDLTYTWSTGETTAAIHPTPSQTTTYYVTATNGITTCEDSLTITVLSTSSLVIDSTVCDSMLFAGNYLTISDTYYDTLSNAVGCDSVVTLNLTINNSVATNDSITACDSTTWNGTTYTTSGIYTQTLQTINGCDSVVTMDITIHPSPVFTFPQDTLAACNVDSILVDAGAGYNFYAWSNGENTQQIYAANSGTYSVTVTDANGCIDSDDVLVDILNVDIVQNDTTICEGDLLLERQECSFYSKFKWFKLVLFR